MNQIRVLVVDDKKIIGDFFDFTLGYLGHQVKVINNPNEVVSILQKDRFDIAFLDIVMPEKDGVEVLKDIKSTHPELPVVMMTGYTVEEKRSQALDLGAVTCLKKPFELSDVQRAVQEAIGKDIE